MRRPPISVFLRRLTGPCTLFEQKIAIEFTDRYDALGMDPPEPGTCCRGGCEGTGFIPRKNPHWINPETGKGSDFVYEEDFDRWEEPWITLWNESEEECPTDDGWHFVKCPECGGTGKRCTEALVVSGDPTSYGDFADRMVRDRPSFGVSGSGRVMFSGEVDDAFHQLWIEEPPEEVEQDSGPVITPGVNPETVHQRQVNPSRSFDKIPVGFDDIPSSIGMPIETPSEPEEDDEDIQSVIRQLQDILGSHPGGRRELPQQAALKVPW